MWRCEPASAGVAPQVIPHVAQEVAPPPRPRAAHAPRRANMGAGQKSFKSSMDRDPPQGRWSQEP
eukprot:7835981-Alexandrium_andersonii.AAC.1